MSAKPDQPFVSRWYADRGALEFLALRYLPWLMGLSLVWEFAQLPLYTIWSEASAPYIVYYTLHCVVGDVLIGMGSMALALLMLRAPRLSAWHWPRVVALSMLFGASYTVVSEWMNTDVLLNWQYSDRMPTVALGRFDLGLSPLAQWLLISPIAIRIGRYWQSRRDLRRARQRASR